MQLKKKSVLYQLLINYINKKYEIITIKKITIMLILYHLFKKVLDLILVEKNKNKKDLNLKNLFQF